MRRTLYLSAFAFLTFSVATSCNDNKKAKNYNEKTTVDDKGLAFIKATQKAGLVEIKAAKIAQANSKNSRVLGFAKMMIVDHITAESELKKLANQRYTTIADTVLEPQHQHMIDSITKLAGPAFDKAYMEMMVTDHIQVVDLFKSATGNHTKAIKDFAEKTLPVLEMHLDSAKVISASLK